MTNDDNRSLLETFQLTVRWRQLAELVGDAKLSCIDGRHTGCTLGAPGGDTGEFILLFGAIEHATETAFSSQRIEVMLEHYMDRHGRFYLHTDRNAITQLAETISQDEELGAALSEAGSIDALLNRPPAKVRARLLELLVEPRHVGCGHLRTMLEHIEEYDVRLELVEDAIRSFFRLLWRGNPKADFTVLEGVHEESVIITFDTEQTLEADTLIPSVCAAEDGPYLFANHEAARRYKRRLDLAMVSEVEDLVLFEESDDDEQALQRLLDEAERLAERQAAATISHLAPDLPSYTARFEGRELTTDMVD
jgi:hypothetical protein